MTIGIEKTAASFLVKVLGLYCLLAFATLPAVATTYTWNPANASGTWSVVANWLVGGAVATTVPTSADQAVFDSAATVTLSADAPVSNVTFNADVTLSGSGTYGITSIREFGGTGHTVTLNGSGFKTMNNGSSSTVRTYTISNSVAVVAGTSNWIKPYGVYSTITMWGDITGSGILDLTMLPAGTGYGTYRSSGVVLHGNNTAFSGMITDTFSMGTDRKTTRIYDSSASSSNAVWNIENKDGASGGSIFSNGDTSYYFGALFGSQYIKAQYNVVLEIGALNLVCTTAVTTAGSSLHGKVRKVGTASLTLTQSNMSYLEINGGTVVLDGTNSLPGTSISFTGSGATLSFTPSFTNADGFIDVSSKITNSTAAIGFDDCGSNLTWATALASSNVGGLTKKGAGTLTLAATPAYTGDTRVEAGNLVFSTATSCGRAMGALKIASGSTLTFAGDPTWQNGTTNTLFTYTNLEGTVNANTILVTGLGARADYELVTSTVDGTTTVSAVVSNEKLVWNGANGTDWTTADAWLGVVASTTPFTFTSGDVVRFNDDDFGETVAATNDVTISTTVDPSIMTVDVVAGHGYRFTGAGAIAASDTATPFTKKGVGAAILSNTGTNAFAAGIVVEDGELAVTADNVAGAAISNAATFRVNAPDTVVSLGAITGTGTNFIDAGTAVLTAASPSCFSNTSTMVLTADSSVTKDYQLLGSGDLVVSNCTLTVGSVIWGMRARTGSIYARGGGLIAAYHPQSDRPNNMFGTGGDIVLENGYIYVSYYNRRPIELQNRIVVADGTVNGITNNCNYLELTCSGRLTGGGTLWTHPVSAYGVRYGGDNSGFTGTFNFDQDAATLNASGLMSKDSASSNATWNVVGTPASPTVVFDIDHDAKNQTSYYGALNVVSANAIVDLSNGGTLKIGNLNTDCVINGSFTNENGTVTFDKVGTGSLAFGTDCQFLPASLSPTFLAEAGTLAINATNPINGTVSVAADAVLTGSFSATNIVFASGAVLSNALVTATAPVVCSNTVDISGLVVKVVDTPVAGTSYKILTAKSFTGKATLVLPDGVDATIWSLKADPDGANQTLTLRKSMGFVIRICDSDIAIPQAWYTANLSSDQLSSDDAISNALVSAGANGIARWESYALGLNPNDVASVVLCGAKQDADATRMTFYAANIAPVSDNTAITFSYVLEGFGDSKWNDVVVTNENALSIELPGIYSLYRVRTDVILQ